MTPVRLALAVGLVALFVHAPASQGAFLWYDDLRYVVENPHLDDLSNAGRYFTDLETTASPQRPTRDIYRPIRTLVFALLVQTAGRDATAFHWVSIVVHAATASVLLLVLLRAGLGRWPAALGALAFALHPVTVESVAWVCSLGDLLCGLFALLSLLLYAGDRLLLALLALVLALFSKEHAVVVPGLWLGWDVFLRRERLASLRAALPAVARGPLAALAVAIAFLVFRGALLDAKMSQVDAPLGGSTGAAALTMLAGLGWYAATILFPYGPTFNARVPDQHALLSLPVLLGLAVLGGLLWGVLRGPRRSRLGFAWFLMALVPVSNLLVTLKIPTADRFLYLPLMGLALVAGELVARARPLATKVAPAVLVVLAALTVARTGDWRDDASLVAAGLRVNPRDRALLWAEAAAKHNEAAARFTQGRPELGWPIAQRAEELYVTYLRNAELHEQVEVYVALGDLRLLLAEQAERAAMREEHMLRSRAMEAYFRAWELQKQGLGRIYAAQIRHVAERLVLLGRELAEPANPDLGRTIELTLEAADYLRRNHGYDDRWTRAVLRLADSKAIRGTEPEKARQGYRWVLETIAELESEGKTNTTFVKAEATFFLGIVGGRAAASRPLMEDAYHLYLDAARRNPGARMQGLAYAARAACRIGQIFDDPAWVGKARAILERLPEVAKRDGLLVPWRLQREIEVLERDCGR